MRFEALGGIRVVGDDGHRHDVASRAQRIILGALLANLGTAVTIDALCDAVWGEAAPPTAIGSLRSQVARLRRLVGDRLVSAPGAFRLVLRPTDTSDVTELDAAIADARRAVAGHVDDRRAGDRLRRALAAWQGRPFGDIADTTTTRSEAARLDAVRLDALELVAQLDVRGGRPGDAIAAMERLVTEHPLRESAWVSLVTAAVAAGRAAEGVRAADRAARALAEAGLVVGDSLRRAEAQALGLVEQGEVELQDGHGSAGRVPRPPAPLTETIGRSDEHALVVDRIRSGRLVTLVGPGGVGKTRLAIDVARAVAEEYQGGAVVVDLASVRAPDDVGAAVAHALRVPTDRREVSDALADAGDHDLLVLFDNCEHVIDASAKVVRTMLEGGTRLRVLTTSREPLGIAGEHVIPISPLPLDADGSAVTLFEERARMAAPHLDLERNRTAAVVRRLDGLPIAIEMAAARLRTMTLAELEMSLDSGLSVLSSARRDVDERQRTVRSLLAWSDVLLDEREREIWWAIATFAAPVTAHDVATMTGDPAAAETLQRLADQSLVTVNPRDSGTRFTVLELVRAYVREQADAHGRSHELGSRHAAWIRQLAADIDADLRTDREPAAIARFSDVFDEIRHAVHWSLAADHDTTVALLASIVTACRQVLRPELVTWARLATEALGDGHPGLATVRAVLATGLAYSGQLEAAREVGELAMGGDLHGVVLLSLLDSLGDVASYEGRLDDAISYYDREHALAAEAGDATSIALSRAGAAVAKAYQGRQDEAVRSLEGATSTSISGEGWLWYGRGEALLERDPETALASLDRAVECAVRAGNRFLTEVGLLSSSSVTARTGDPAVAAARFVDLLGLYSEAGDEKHLLTTLRNIVPLLVRMGDHRSAATLFGATADHPLVPSFGPEAERLRVAATECERAMTGPAFERAVAEGRTHDLAAAMATACAALTSATPAARAGTGELFTTRDDDDDDDDDDGDGDAAASIATGRWVRRGEVWLIEYRGATASLPDVKGLHDLATLLAAPHSEVHALHLVGGVEVAGAADYVLDDAARTAYRRRIQQLRADIEMGRERGEEGRVRRAEDELDALLAELSAGVSRGGRPRATASSHERARSTVTNRIRAALHKIDAVHPELGRHLRNAIHTGTWCSYRPEHDMTWIISTT